MREGTKAERHWPCPRLLWASHHERQCPRVTMSIFTCLPGAESLAQPTAPTGRGRVCTTASSALASTAALIRVGEGPETESTGQREHPATWDARWRRPASSERPTRVGTEGGDPAAGHAEEPSAVEVFAICSRDPRAVLFANYTARQKTPRQTLTLQGGQGARVAALADAVGMAAPCESRDNLGGQTSPVKASPDARRGWGSCRRPPGRLSEQVAEDPSGSGEWQASEPEATLWDTLGK